MSRPEAPFIVSVIVPVYRDNEALEVFLKHPAHQTFLEQTVVVLGEEDEEAIRLCEAFGVKCLKAKVPGRAVQMNTGAAQAVGDILLFLHADTLMPAEGINRIRGALERGAVGGGFSRRFDHPSRFLRFTCWLADWRAKVFGWLLGDQAIFVRRDVFVPMGGLPGDLPFRRFGVQSQNASIGQNRIVTPARPLLGTPI